MGKEEARGGGHTAGSGAVIWGTGQRTREDTEGWKNRPRRKGQEFNDGTTGIWTKVNQEEDAAKNAADVTNKGHVPSDYLASKGQ